MADSRKPRPSWVFVSY